MVNAIVITVDKIFVFVSACKEDSGNGLKGTKTHNNALRSDAPAHCARLHNKQHKAGNTSLLSKSFNKASWLISVLSGRDLMSS